MANNGSPELARALSALLDQPRVKCGENEVLGVAVPEAVDALSARVDTAWLALEEAVSPECGSERIREVRELLAQLLTTDWWPKPALLAWMAACVASDFSGISPVADEAQAAAEAALEWLEGAG